MWQAKVHVGSFRLPRLGYKNDQALRKSWVLGCLTHDDNLTPPNSYTYLEPPNLYTYLGTYLVRRKYYFFLSISMTIYQFLIALGFHLKITHYLVSI